MSKRKRLTEREAATRDPAYPGTVNQPDRQFKRDNQYDNWDETLNHPTPDMRHDWQDNPRDGIGFGIPKDNGGEVIVDPITKRAPAPSQDGGDGQGAPTVASAKIAASKAVRLSFLLLGEKVPEAVVEDQARDFMAMGQDTLDRTLARFADTQKFYAEEEVEEEEEVVEASDKKAADEAEEKAEEKAAETIQEETEEEAKKEKEASKNPDFETAVAEKVAAMKKAEDEEAEEKEDEKTAAESKEAFDARVQAEVDKRIAANKKAEDEDEKEDDGDSKEASIALSGPNEMDIELSASMDDVDIDPETNNLLQAAIFGADEPELPQMKEASEKQGVTKLGGQPKVASDSSGKADISSIWAQAPDVSQIFN